jgi:general secretion pathway protein J
MKTRKSGFSLVEVLVVLVIGSFVSALLFQMLAQTYRLRGRFADQLVESQTGRMRADWLRETLRGLETVTQDSPFLFTGRSTTLQGLTSAPVATSGAQLKDFRLEWIPRPTGWELQYADGQTPWPLLVTGAFGSPGFRYVDDQGGEHDQWPPRASPPAPPISVGPNSSPRQGTAQWRQLPTAILVSWFDLSGRKQVLVAAVNGDRDAKRPRFNMGGLP